MIRDFAGNRKGVILAVTLGVTAIFSLSSFSLEPITADLSPVGPQSVQTFRLTNPSNEPIALRIQVFTRDLNEEGREINQPADTLFTVYPSRVLLNPRAIQLVRVQWRGDPNPSRELAFRVVVEQLPVEFGESRSRGGAIRILTRYVGALYIVPDQAKPEIQINLQGIGTNKEGRKGVSLLVKNVGTAHTLLNDLKIELSLGSKTLQFQEDALPGLAGENLLAGSQKPYFLPFPEELPELDVSTVSINFTYEATR
ncbi:MAG: fimbria/pilus periplasmic chaperone [Spirochaetales bacterium]